MLVPYAVVQSSLLMLLLSSCTGYHNHGIFSRPLLVMLAVDKPLGHQFPEALLQVTTLTQLPKFIDNYIGRPFGAFVTLTTGSDPTSWRISFICSSCQQRSSAHNLSMFLFHSLSIFNQTFSIVVKSTNIGESVTSLSAIVYICRSYQIVQAYEYHMSSTVPSESPTVANCDI